MIYLAGPLFTTAEREFNEKLARSIQDNLAERVFLPQVECSQCSTPQEIFTVCKKGIDQCRIVVAVLDGPDADSGTCFEAGYAHAREIPIIGIRTDFRQRGDDGGLNLMLSRSCSHCIYLSSLEHADALTEITAELKKVL